ncbi:MAG: TlpA disulfide reductase family protein [Chitinophagaceae bacterium]
MKRVANAMLVCFLSVASSVSFSQKITVSGKLTGDIAKRVRQVQFIHDGKLDSLNLHKEDHTFSGDIKLLEPQFVEIKSGNQKPLYFYLVPNEKILITIDKPSLQESIVTISNNKINKLQDIFNTYYSALQEKGIDTKSRDWHQLLFNNNEPLTYAETKLKEQLASNAALVSSVPNFKSDLLLFMKSFRNYTMIDKMSLNEIEKALQELKTAKLKRTALNIPFHKEYLTDLTNAYAARTLEKYGISIDNIKQKYVSQFIAAEAISKYISDTIIRSSLFSEKLRIELPTNGLKNEEYVLYLYENSSQSVKDSYKEKIELLKANKVPDLTAARKKAFNFLLHDSTGKEYKLDDFKGKMLFIDFWASWCAPCKAQIPHQKELEKSYAGKNIVFASVSLDKSKPAWLKSVKEEDLHGVILHAKGDFKNEFPKAYGIESIPRYMLIDANGYIISDNMIRPENKKEIKGIFDDELFGKNTEEILEKHFKALGAEVLKTNGLLMKYRQSVVSFNINGEIYYSFPDKFKNTNQFEETEQMLMILGKEYFTEKYAVMNGEKVTTNNPSLVNLKETWINKLFGLELFLRKTVNNSIIKFAEENETNTDSCYVLKLKYNNTEERYYINKKNYLIDKLKIFTINLEPRKGGGYFETFVNYEDYRNVNGLMIPFKINQANLITIKVQNAEVKPLDKTVFDN